MFQQIGKMIVLVGLVVAAAGGVVYLLGRLGLGRLPGDMAFSGKNWRIYLPIGTSLLLSAVLTLIFYLLHHLRR